MTTVSPALPAPGDAEALLRLVCDVMAEALVVTDITGKVILIGAAARRLIGLDADAPPPRDWAAVPGRYLEDAVTPVPVERLLVTRALRGESVDSEVFCFRRPGSEDCVWVDGSARPICDGDGQVQGCVMVWRDVSAHRRFEAAMRGQLEMQSWLTKIAATVPGVICSFKLRPDGSVCMPYASPALLDLYGLHPDAVRADAAPVMAMIHEDDIGHVNASIADSAAAMTPWRDEFRVRHSHKGERWIGGQSMPERAADGSILWHGYIADISDRKRSEAALAASESRFRLAMEAITSVVYDWDRLAGSVGWSGDLRRKFGIGLDDPDDGLRWWRQHVHPDDRSRVRAEIRGAMRAGDEQLQVEYRMRHHDGSWIHISDRARIVRNCSGKAVRVVGSLTDISFRKNAEDAMRRLNDTLEEQVAERTAEAEGRSRALAESERFARETIDALESSLCVLDADGRIITVNKAWREFARANGGLAERFSEGADYLAVCDAAARAACAPAAEMARAIRAAASGRRQDFALEYECHSPTQRRWFVSTLTSFQGVGPLRLVIAHENITERKLAEEAQLESARRLKGLAAHLETVREEQNATIAREVHDELGGTLTMLKLGLATAVDGMEADAPMQERLRRMLDQVDSALQTVKRVAAGLRPAMLDTLGLVATIKWHAGEFSRLTGIAAHLRLPTYIRLSSERSTAVFRIVQEALTNVARHAEATRVSVVLSKGGEQLILDIRDNGIGLNRDSLSKADSFGVLGMHERAQFLGGQLRITGMTNGGTRLSLRIPLDEPAGRQS